MNLALAHMPRGDFVTQSLFRNRSPSPSVFLTIRGLEESSAKFVTPVCNSPSVSTRLEGITFCHMYSDVSALEINSLHNVKICFVNKTLTFPGSGGEEQRDSKSSH